MPPFAKTLLTAALLTIGAGTGLALAEEREVNDIWWSLEKDDGSRLTTCVAENYNDFTVDAVFDIFPATYDYEGNPAPGRTVLTMKPYTTYKLYGWPEGAGPDPHCALRSFTAHIQ